MGMRPRVKMSQAELDEIVRLHHMYQIARPGGLRALLSYRDLSGLNLSGKNLSDADFSGAHLIGCNLSQANFQHSNFFGCNLSKANFRGATLIRADLRGACLRGTDLTGANLFDCDLRDGRIAVRDRKGGFTDLPSDIGTSELERRHPGQREPVAGQADRHAGAAHRFHRCDHARLQAGARRPAPRDDGRRQPRRRRSQRRRSAQRLAARRQPDRRRDGDDRDGRRRHDRGADQRRLRQEGRGSAGIAAQADRGAPALRRVRTAPRASRCSTSAATTCAARLRWLAPI